MAARRMRLDTEDTIAKVVGASYHHISENEDMEMRELVEVARLCHHLVLLNFEIP